MGRAPCCDKANVKKGPWSPEEDEKLKDYIQTHGTGGNWIALPHKAGLRRCGKSCRLRWLNYLRPNIKHGEFSDDEDRVICALFSSIGSRWSIMAAQLPGRTDNDIKNYWNTKLKKKMMNNFISRPIHHLQSLTSSTNYTYPSLSNFHHLQSTPHVQESSLYTYNTTATTTISDHHHDQHDPILQSQDLGYNGLSPMRSTYQGEKDNSTLVMFGGDQAPSSSSNSDGSYSHYGVYDQHNMGNMRSDSYKEFGVNNIEKEKGYYGDSSLSLDSSLEEIKQLISTDICSSKIIDNNNLTFFVDENETKDVEKLMYYY